MHKKFQNCNSTNNKYKERWYIHVCKYKSIKVYVMSILEHFKWYEYTQKEMEGLNKLIIFWKHHLHVLKQLQGSSTLSNYDDLRIRKEGDFQRRAIAKGIFYLWAYRR